MTDDKFPSTVAHITSSLSIARTQVDSLNVLYERCKEERDNWRKAYDSAMAQLEPARQKLSAALKRIAELETRLSNGKREFAVCNETLLKVIQERDEARAFIINNPNPPLDISPPAATRGDLAVLRAAIVEIGNMVRNLHEKTEQIGTTIIGDLGQL